MTEIEAKAILALRPYFSPDPIVFDVGSNKGEWSDVLVKNVKEMHLFEANARLLIYTMVKYDSLKNVTYVDRAVTDKTNQEIEFFYFTNENNGLSSIYDNPGWDYLPKQKKKVNTTSLDQYWLYSQVIDLVKIDVEGAEVDVLKGSERLLKSKQIKFIQIEHSDHYHLSGHVFQDAVDYVRGFGYEVYHFTGDGFEKYTGQQAENFYIMAEFTQDWNGEFKKNTQGLKFDFALEIGSFEGLTSTYICNNLLNKDGRLICIDPLTEEYLPGHEDNAMFTGQFDRFTRNTKGYPIELIRKRSLEAFTGGFMDYRFDFIYVDGDHTRDGVYLDGMNAFHLCKVGGHILFDDYLYRQETKEGIDRVLKERSNLYTLVSSGYQIMIKKLREC